MVFRIISGAKVQKKSRTTEIGTGFFCTIFAEMLFSQHLSCILNNHASVGSRSGLTVEVKGSFVVHVDLDVIYSSWVVGGESYLLVSGSQLYAKRSHHVAIRLLHCTWCQ